MFRRRSPGSESEPPLGDGGRTQRLRDALQTRLLVLREQASDRLVGSTMRTRVNVILLALGVGALALAGFIANHQLFFNHAFLERQGTSRTVRTETIPAHRGMILDRNGEILAVSTPVVTLWANPKLLGDDDSKWAQVAAAGDWTAEELVMRKKQYRNKSFMYVKRALPPPQAEAIMAQYKVEGLFDQKEYKRYYPAGEVTAHLVGFNNIDDKGQEGIELAYNEALTGVPGQRRVMKDRKDRVIRDLGVVKPEQRGADISLSIDLRVQFFAHTILQQVIQEFQAQGGSAVVLDVKTGEVVAMVNAPSFNPNNRVGITPQQMRNRAMVDQFEPGSTVKPLTVAAGLVSGKWRPTSIIDTNPGWITVQGKQFKDYRNYGVMDVNQVILKSSQVGVIRIAMSLEPDEVRTMFHLFGLGQPTGTNFPGEVSGLLPTYARWRDIDRATLSFGHGVAATTLQMARAYSILANKGLRREISLLRQEQPLPGEQVVSPEIVAQILPMLEGVTRVGGGGTGTQAAVPGYRVGGKTGTVHKLGPGGYSAHRYVGMFSGIAPMSDPRYAVSVMIDEPSGGKYFGGAVAAPVFGRLMQGVLQLMGVVPDDLQALHPPAAAGQSKTRATSASKGGV